MQVVQLAANLSAARAAQAALQAECRRARAAEQGALSGLQSLVELLARQEQHQQQAQQLAAAPPQPQPASQDDWLGRWGLQTAVAPQPQPLQAAQPPPTQVQAPHSAGPQVATPARDLHPALAGALAALGLLPQQASGAPGGAW